MIDEAGSSSCNEEDLTARAVSLLMNLRGVLLAKLLKIDERQELLSVEESLEQRIVLGMCRTYNRGVREALQRDASVAIVINTSEFIYPHEPHMRMLHKDRIVGEEVYDKGKVAELRRIRNNVFLWNNFVVYRDRLPRDPRGRDEMRLTYLPRRFPELEKVEGIEDCIFGEPSTEGDVALKKMVRFTSTDPVIGSCVVGFNIRKCSHI